MSDMPGIQIAAAERDRAAVVGDRVDLPAARVDANDGRAGAVDHTVTLVVSQTHDPVAGLQLVPAAGGEGGAGEATRGVQAGAGPVVEIVHVQAS